MDHVHHSVQLLSSSPLSESVDRPHVDKSDPEFGLHGYTLHFTLHTTATEIMSGHYHHLSSSKGSQTTECSVNKGHPKWLNS